MAVSVPVAEGRRESAGDGKSMSWRVAAAVAGLACAAVAGERRDLVFDCPCVAEWAAGQEGERGTLTLSGGVRSLRATASGPIRVTVAGEATASQSPGGVPAGDRLQTRWTLELAEPGTGAVLELDLEEAVGTGPGDAAQWHRHETLALWPVPTSEGSPASMFVDILTDADADGDGVGDMNERLAGTSPEDPASRPDDSVVDVLVFFSAAYRDDEGGYPQTRLLHELTVAEAIFEDSGTGIRLRIVGMREEEPDQQGWVPESGLGGHPRPGRARAGDGARIPGTSLQRRSRPRTAVGTRRARRSRSEIQRGGRPEAARRPPGARAAGARRQPGARHRGPDRAGTLPGPRSRRHRRGLGDVRGLPFFHRLEHLGVAGLDIRDASALAGLPLRSLGLARNPLSDAAALSSLTSLVRLDLAETGLSEVEPLRELAALERLDLGSNAIADIRPLAGLAALQVLHLENNRIAEVQALAGLGRLEIVDIDRNRVTDLRDNRIADLAPLIANDALGQGDWVALDGNPLSEIALNEQIPALLERGVEVGVDRVALVLVAGGPDRRFDTAGYFEALLGTGVEAQVAVDDPTLARAEMSAGMLVLTPGTVPGTATATVTATGADGTVATLDFVATIRGPARAPWVASARDAMREGCVRIVNRSAEAGVVGIAAIDDAGSRRRGISLAIGGGEALHFNSADLEAGNPDKRLTGGAGRGSGDWRLEFETTLEIDVLTYVRTADGFLTAMHDVAGAAAGRWQVPTFNPASNTQQISSLSISNLAAEDAVAAINGIDDAGASPGGEVRIDIPAGTTVTLAATELEAGSSRLAGSLGDGAGKWRLIVESAGELAIASLLASPEGHLSNLSTGPLPPDADGVVTAGLFASAGARQGFVRIVNRSARHGEVRIDAYDDLGRRAEPVTLAIGARRTVHFNSDDLELGNAEKGLSGRTGAGSGDWRLEMHSALDIDVLVYVRTPGGFLAAMHDVVARQGRRYDVAMFNPGGNARQASRLRIVNPGTRPAYVSIAGVDDEGRSPGDVARLTIDPGTARTISAAQLEEGAWGIAGRLGDGTGKWRLRIDCEQPVLIMNLMESASGHLTNLSTTGQR